MHIDKDILRAATQTSRSPSGFNRCSSIFNLIAVIANVHKSDQSFLTSIEKSYIWDFASTNAYCPPL